MSKTLTDQIMLLTRKNVSDKDIANILKTSVNNVRVLRHNYRKKASIARVNHRVIPTAETYQKPIHRLPPSDDEYRSLTGSSLNF